MAKEIQLNLPSSFSNEFVAAAAGKLARRTRSDEVNCNVHDENFIARKSFVLYYSWLFQLTSWQCRQHPRTWQRPKNSVPSPLNSILIRNNVSASGSSFVFTEGMQCFLIKLRTIDCVSISFCHPSKKTFLSHFCTVPPSPPVIIVVSEF